MATTNGYPDPKKDPNITVPKLVVLFVTGATLIISSVFLAVMTQCGACNNLQFWQVLVDVIAFVMAAGGVVMIIACFVIAFEAD